MARSNLFTSSQLKPQWSFSATNILWRFLVSEEGLILGEDRNTVTKTVSFFCVAMKTGRVLWRDNTYGEAWWTGIEALVGGRLFIHGFAQPNMPEHRGLIALDARTGTEIWRNPDISFYAADAVHVVGYRDLFERRVFEQFDAGTGVFIREIDCADGTVAEMRVRAYGRTDFTYPQPLTVDAPGYELIHRAIANHAAMPHTQVLKDSAHTQVVKDSAHTQAVIEFAYAHGFACISAHILHATVPGAYTKGLKNILCIVNAETGKENYFDVLNADTPYPVPDSFFIDDAALYYIREKRTLVCVGLLF